ncbi:hypothetical protein ACLOJK_035213 [Asimina triloba]
MFLSSSPSTSSMMMMLLLSSSLLFSALIVCAATSNMLGSQQLPSTPQNQTVCIHDDFSALLHLKQHFDSETSDTLLSSWNASNEDCCSWRRVTCDRSTGHVISLDLTYCGISGRLDFGSSAYLGGLQSLQQLHLWGDFGSSIPSGLDQLPNLIHLHLEAPFSGHILLDVSRLKHLVSLQELSLDSVDIVSAQGEQWEEALSALPNLRKLSMSGCNLSGPIHPSLPLPSPFANRTPSQLHQSLLLCNALNLHSKLHFSHKLDSHLQLLILSETGFHGGLPDSLGNLKRLSTLEATDCNLSGPLPPSLVNLTSLQYLILSFNNLSGPLPSSYTNGQLGRLQRVDLSHNKLSGTIPPLFFLPQLLELSLEGNRFTGFAGEFQNMPFAPLQQLHLQDNNLQGPLPDFIFQLKNLTWLDLSMNNFSGILDLYLFLQLRNLKSLSLSDNVHWSIQDGRDSSTFAPLPSLSSLSLHSCNISRFPNVLSVASRISYLDLSNNNIRGKIPQWVWTLGTGHYDSLNLSHNQLEGYAQPSSNLSLMGSWGFIDLSFNKLEGSMIIPPQSIIQYSLANNLFSGEVPSLICNSKSLVILDLSRNSFSGSIPPCLGELSKYLDVLNLQGNGFRGTLNQTFKEGCALRTLDVSGNHLQGQLPASLANCSALELLNFEDNQIHDTFPSWLENFPLLRVLILRWNKFYGPVQLKADAHQASFSQLQIFDISSNGFTGSLPTNMFKSWKVMIEDNQSFSILSHYAEISDDPWAAVAFIPHQDTTSLFIKGREHDMEKIFTTFTLIDLSNNKFQGSIPESIGDLRSLVSLNMSYNDFTGQIPASLENLRFLETLDLSQNSFSGEIPPQLTKLNFLAVLNLSHNLLVGTIPQGQQFSSFSNDSFLSNLGLCGPPLSMKCGEANNIPPLLSRQIQGRFDWDFLWSGFAVGNGVGVGLFFWTLVLWTKGRTQFLLFIDKMLLFVFPSLVFTPIRYHRKHLAK